MTRIGIIREAVGARGGCYIAEYWVDNTGYLKMSTFADADALYKVPTWADGLTREQRAQVVKDLKQHPDVKDAYLSRPYGKSQCKIGGHLKVRFYGLA